MREIRGTKARRKGSRQTRATTSLASGVVCAAVWCSALFFYFPQDFLKCAAAAGKSLEFYEGEREKGESLS